MPRDEIVDVGAHKSPEENRRTIQAALNRAAIVERCAWAAWENNKSSALPSWEDAAYTDQLAYRAIVRTTIAALIEACPLVAGLIDDHDGIRGAVERMLRFNSGPIDPNEDGWAAIKQAEVDQYKVNAWLTGAGGHTDGQT
jgi:hypothetical protein